MPRLISRVTAALIWAAFSLCASCQTPAFAQSTVLQGGPYSQSHIPQYAGQGNGQAVLKDGGGAGGGAIGANPSEMGITATGQGTAPFAGQGKGPYGSIFTLYDAPTNSPNGYHYLGFSPNAQGGGLLAYGYGGAASPLPLQFIVNGQTYTFPFSSGGTNSAISVADLFALQALPITQMAAGTTVTVSTYSASRVTLSPPVDYYLTQTACAIDAGSCVAAATIGYYWHITPQTIWDPRWWGAYADALRIGAVTTVTSGSCVVAVAGAAFTSTDVGKRIVITDAITSAANGPTYSSSIQLVGGGGTVTVAAPCPTFNSSIAQVVYYGHDDSTALNTATTYLGTLYGPFMSGQPVLSGGGLGYGVYSAPFIVSTNLALENIYLTALGSDHLPLVTSGVLEFNGAFSTGLNVTVDAAYLPVNACFGSGNGTIWWNSVRCKNWLGHAATPTTIAGATTSPASVFTGSIASCSSGSSFGFACTLTVTGTPTGAIRPGMSLYDATPTIPKGTYVLSYGDNTTTGAAGTYIVYNITASPAVGSETISALGLDISVPSCSGANQGQVGLVSHGNTLAGILDRTMIVACSNSKITLNKAPQAPLSNASLNFYQDSNGLYLTASAGFTATQLTTNQDNFLGIAGNQYGCALYNDSAGGTQITHANLFQGAANVCLGPDSTGNDFRQVFMSTNYGGATACCEVNAPAIVMFDGWKNAFFSGINYSGQIQSFNVASTSPLSPQVAILNPRIQDSAGQIVYAPSNAIMFYTERTGTSIKNITTSPYGAFGLVFSASNGQPRPAEMFFGSGGSGSWAELTPQQINLTAQSMAVTLSAGSQQGFPEGVNLFGSPIINAERPLVTKSAAYTFSEADCGSDFRLIGSSYSVFVPNYLGFNVTAATPSTCEINIISTNSGSVTLVPLSIATTLFEAGSTTVSVTLTQNVPFTLWVPTNPDGASATGYVTKHNN